MIDSCQSMLDQLSIIRSTIMQSINHQAIIDNQLEDVNNADDYICLLSFSILSINQFSLISRLSTMNTMNSLYCSESQSFADMMTAIKLLIDLHDNCDDQLIVNDHYIEQTNQCVRRFVDDDDDNHNE